MVQMADPVTLSLPRQVLTDLATLTDEMTDRMHALLERNTDGQLDEVELRELEFLTSVAQFGRIIALALRDPARQ
jgi:hypothetical protein